MKKEFDGEITIPGHDGPTKRSKIVIPDGVEPDPKKPYEYKQLVKKMEHFGSIDREDFKNAKDLTNFLDFYNQSVDKKKEKELEVTARDIATSLVNNMNSKSFRV